MAAPASVADGSDTAQSTRATGCASGRHRLRPMGYVRGSGPAWLDCDRPLHVVCRDCDFVTRWACSGHRESRCRPCATRYRRRVRRVVASGLGRQARGWEYFLTLTAPGRRQHRQKWSREHAGEMCPCTPAGGVDLARWNASHSARWNHLRTVMKRRHPGLEFFRGVEVQERGALHDHALIWSPTPIPMSELRAIALAAGFGHSVDLAPVVPGSKREAYYVSKYITKATDQRADVPWWGQRVDYSTGEVSEGIVDGRYRTWSMSKGWGDTMATVRAAGAVWWEQHQATEDWIKINLIISVLGGELILPDESPPSPS